MKSGCKNAKGIGPVWHLRIQRCLPFCSLPLLFFLACPVGFIWAEEQVAQVLPTRKITLQFQGMDIVEILKILAEQAGFNLVAGRNVTGRVTLFLKEVDPWEALEVILAANDLAYEKRGQILTIMTQRDYELLHGQPYQDRRVIRSITPRFAKAADLSRTLSQVKSNIGRVVVDEASNTLILLDTPSLVEQMARLIQEMDLPVQTRVFRFNYATAKAIAPVLQETITKGVGKISVDERTNQVTVTDYPLKLDEIARIAEAFDERATEVYIEAAIVQVTLSDKFQLGIDWEAIGRKSLALKGLTALNLTAGGQLKIASSENIARGRAGDYKATIELLRTFGDTKILSEPRITVVNNQEAKILVGSKEPFVTKSISQTGTGTAVTSESVTFLDVGVKLFVTPTITRDRFIVMKVRPEISSKTGTLITSEKNEIPIIETTEAETVLLVEDGGMVILGGLIKDEKSLDEQRIPILGDIPVLGRLFKNTKETLKKTETVVFLRPQIVTGRRVEGQEEWIAPAELLPPGEAPPSAPALGQVESTQAVSETLTLEGYGQLVMEQVRQVARVQSLLLKEKGKAVVQFALTPDGRLRGSPKALQADSEVFKVQAEQAVLVASPFPPFPPGLPEEPLTFVVPLSYE